MPPWSPRPEPVSIEILRNELKTFARDALRAELATFASTVSAQMVTGILKETTLCPSKPKETGKDIPSMVQNGAPGLPNEQSLLDRPRSASTDKTPPPEVPERKPLVKKLVKPFTRVSHGVAKEVEENHNYMTKEERVGHIEERNTRGSKHSGLIEETDPDVAHVVWASELQEVAEIEATSPFSDDDCPRDGSLQIGSNPRELTGSDAGAVDDFQAPLKRRGISQAMLNNNDMSSGGQSTYSASPLLAHSTYTLLDADADAEEEEEEEEKEEKVEEVFECTLENCVRSTMFDSMASFLVFSNLVLIGVETQYMAKYEVHRCPQIFLDLDDIFCIIFSIEITLRMCVYGTEFWIMPTWYWNVFDCIIIGVQVIDLVLRVLYPYGYLKVPDWVHLFRLLRFLRVIRAVRVVHLLKDLRVLTGSILESMKPLGWTVLLLALITFMFSIFLTMIVTNHRVTAKTLSEENGKEEEVDEALVVYYGGIERSTLALYEMISDGIHWGELVEPLREISPWLELVFATYSGIVVLVMMNIVLGIFVDSVMRTTENTKKRELMSKMQRLFEETDEDGSGFIDWSEFESQLVNPDMQAFLKEIDMDEQGAHDLFNLLDVDDVDEVSAADFVSGCSRLSGAAKAMDIAVIQHEQRLFHTAFGQHADLLERSVSHLTDTITSMAEQLRLNSEKQEKREQNLVTAPNAISPARTHSHFSDDT